MNETDALNYVRASAVALDLPLDGARVLRVAGHLQRTAQMAQLLEEFDLGPELELAEIYKPAAFPSAPERRDPS